MATRETPRQRGSRRATFLLRRIGEEFRRARVGAGLAARTVATAAGISHTYLLDIERGSAPRASVDILASVAAVLGMDFHAAVHPVASPLRDRAHLQLLERLRSRLHERWRWRTEVPIPIPGDRRSGDATISGAAIRILVEAETHLSDLQALERDIAGKARDLGSDRVILLVLDTRNNRAVVGSEPALARRFPIGTRAAMAALRDGRDPGGDCLIVL